MKEVRRSRRVELMPSPLPTTLQRTPLRSNQQTTPTGRTSCVGLFAKGDARYLYNIARLEQKYCNPERQKQRHYLVIDCATWKLVPNDEEEFENDDDIDIEEMREQFKKTIHDAFVVPFGEHDIATPAEILSPPSGMRKTATKRSKRSRRRPSSVSVARSVVSTQFEEHYAKRMCHKTHTQSQLCRPDKRHSIEDCLSSSGVFFNKSKTRDTWETDSNASRSLSRRINEDFEDDDTLSVHSGFVSPLKAASVLVGNVRSNSRAPSKTPIFVKPSPDTVVPKSRKRQAQQETTTVPCYKKRRTVDDNNERLTPRTSRQKSKPSLGYDEMLTVDANAVIEQNKVLRSVYSGKSQATIEKWAKNKENAKSLRMAAGGGSPMVATRLERHRLLVALDDDGQGTVDGRIVGAQISRLPGRIYMSREQWNAGAVDETALDEDDTISLRSGFVEPRMRLVAASVRSSPLLIDNSTSPPHQIETAPSPQSALPLVDMPQPSKRRPKRQSTLWESFSSPPTYDSPKAYSFGSFVTVRKLKSNAKRPPPKTISRRDQTNLQCSLALGESAGSERSVSPALSGEIERSSLGRQPTSPATMAARKKSIECWLASTRRASESGQFDDDEHVRHGDRTIRQTHASAKQRNTYNSFGYGN